MSNWLSIFQNPAIAAAQAHNAAAVSAAQNASNVGTPAVDGIGVKGPADANVQGIYEGGTIDEYDFFKGFHFGESMHDIFSKRKNKACTKCGNVGCKCAPVSALTVDSNGLLSFNGDEWDGFGFGKAEGKKRRQDRKDARVYGKQDRKMIKVQSYADRRVARGTAQVELAKLGLQQKSVAADIVGSSGALAQGVAAGLSGQPLNSSGGGQTDYPTTPTFPQTTTYPNYPVGNQLTDTGGFGTDTGVQAYTQSQQNEINALREKSQVEGDASDADTEKKKKNQQTALVVIGAVVLMVIIGIAMKKKK